MNCIRCKKLLSNTDKHICGVCIYYTDEHINVTNSIRELIKFATIGHITVGLVYLLDFDLNIFIQMILNCNMYDETFEW